MGWFWGTSDVREKQGTKGIESGKVATPGEVQAARTRVMEDLKTNYPGFMQLHPDKRQKVFEDALGKVWSRQDQERYHASAEKPDSNPLDAGNFQKLRVRAEELVKSAPAFEGLSGKDRMQAIHDVTLSLGEMTEGDFDRAMRKRGSDERGFWETVGGSAWGTLARTAGSAVKLGERAYSLGDPSYDPNKGMGRSLKNWGDDFEADTVNDKRTTAKVIGSTIGSTAPYVVATPLLGAAGVGATAAQYGLGAVGGAISANDAFDQGVERGLKGKELAACVLAHGGVAALTSYIGARGAQGAPTMTGNLLGKLAQSPTGKTLVQRATQSAPGAARAVGAAGQALGTGGRQVAGSIGDGVITGVMGNVGKNLVDKKFIDPSIGVFDNTYEAALGGGLGAGLSSGAKVGTDALKARIQQGLKSGQYGGAAKRAMEELVTPRRSAAEFVGDEGPAAAKKALHRGREGMRAVGEAADGVVEDFREAGRRVVGHLNGDDGYELAWDGANRGRDRPRVVIDDSPIPGTNDMYMAGKGGHRSKSKEPTKTRDGKVSLEGSVNEVNGVGVVPPSRRPSINDDPHNASVYNRYKNQLTGEEERNPMDPMSGPVIFEDMARGPDPVHTQQVREYVELANLALREGKLSSTGRVSTKGPLRDAADNATEIERARAKNEQSPFKGVAAHVPDTTWTGNAVPPYWRDHTAETNSSLGRQSQNKPIGFKPTRFAVRKDVE
jgi:hypothetical protein